MHATDQIKLYSELIYPFTGQLHTQLAIENNDRDVCAKAATMYTEGEWKGAQVLDIYHCKNGRITLTHFRLPRLKSHTVVY